MRSRVHKNAIKAPKQKRLKYYSGKIDPNSLVLPGPPLTPEQFREIILNREHGPTISFEQMKAEWAERKKELLKLAEQQQRAGHTRK